jgi:hypothetical protein
LVASSKLCFSKLLQLNSFEQLFGEAEPTRLLLALPFAQESRCSLLPSLHIDDIPNDYDDIASALYFLSHFSLYEISRKK